MIATGGEDQTVRLWSTTDGSALGTLSGHTDAVTALAFGPRPDARLGQPGRLDPALGCRHRACLPHVRRARGGRPGPGLLTRWETVASASRDATVWLWDVAVERPKILAKHDGPAWCVAFSPDGTTVVSGGLDKMLRFWPVDGLSPQSSRDRRQPEDRRVPQPRQEGPSVLPVGNDVLAIAFAPDGKTLAAALSNARATAPSPGSIAIVNVPARQIVRLHRSGHLAALRTLALAPDGHTLATGGDDCSIRLRDLTAGTTRAAWLGPRPPGPMQDRIMIHPEPVEVVVFAPDGKTVATATGSPIVTFWDVATRAPDVGSATLPESSTPWPSAPTASRWPPEGMPGS